MSVCSIGMKSSIKFTLIFGIVVLIAVGVWMVLRIASPAPGSNPKPVVTTQPADVTVAYACDAGIAITATYHPGAVIPPATPGEPPKSTGTVIVTLADGKKMTLPQAISADGARYANEDESTVFWNKGRGVMYTDSNSKTSLNCIEVAIDPGGLTETYVSSTRGFSLRYPKGYAVDESYQYQEFGPGKEIAGVKFTIPESVATGTNLATDSAISVEEIPNLEVCTADHFLNGVSSSTPILVEGDVTYSVASSTGAAAGNRYDETVYAIPGTSPCIAVRYTIHYGVFENYPEGSITRFDEQALTDRFDAIRKTLVLAP